MYFLFPQMERWIFSIPALGDGAGAELCAHLSGSEVNSFHQCSLQGDGELIECVQDAGEGVCGSAVTQQSTFLIRPRCQGTLCQQGEPLREKPVSAKRNRSVVNNGPMKVLNWRWSWNSFQQETKIPSVFINECSVHSMSVQSTDTRTNIFK